MAKRMSKSVQQSSRKNVRKCKRIFSERQNLKQYVRKNVRRHARKNGKRYARTNVRTHDRNKIKRFIRKNFGSHAGKNVKNFVCAWSRLALRMLGMVFVPQVVMWCIKGKLFQMSRASKTWSSVFSLSNFGVLLGHWNACMANQYFAEAGPIPKGAKGILAGI